MLMLGVLQLQAQVEVGVTGGVPLTPFILNSETGNRFGFSQVLSAPRRYTVGPYFEFHVHGPLGIETSALYKRFGFDTVAQSSFPYGPVTDAIASRAIGNSWEFPVLGKVHLRLFPRLNGFVSAGPSIRRLTGVTEIGEHTTYYPQPKTTAYRTDSPAGMDRRTSVGAALGAGFEFAMGPLRLSPEFRITRWDSERTSSGPAASRLGRTQAEVLLTLASTIPPGRETPPAHIPCCFEFGLLTGLSLLPASDVRPAQPGSPTRIDVPTHRYAMGALLDWRFHSRLSLEASFVTRPFGHTDTSVYSNISTSSESVSGYSWEVPLLLKWRAARIGSANIVLGAGPAILRGSNGQFTTAFANSAYRSTSTGPFATASSIGAAVSGGIELKARRVRLRPELRYNWFERPLYDFYFIQPRQDSLVLIFGVTQSTRR